MANPAVYDTVGTINRAPTQEAQMGFGFENAAWACIQSPCESLLRPALREHLPLVDGTVTPSCLFLHNIAL